MTGAARKKPVVPGAPVVPTRPIGPAVLTVLPDGHRITVKAGETVLEALYAAGLAYRTGCRRGGCAICKVDVRDGTVSYIRTIADTVMTARERADGTCLSCRAVPDGDLTIELRAERLRVRCRPLLDLRAASGPVPGIAPGTVPDPAPTRPPSLRRADPRWPQ